MNRSSLSLFALSLITFPLGCGGGGSSTASVGSSSEDDGSSEASADTSPSTSSETGGDGDGDGDGEASHCGEVGYEEVAWDDSAAQAAFGELVPDMTVNTLREPFTLSEAWGGCRVFTLVPYHPNFGLSDIEAFVEGGAENNTYIFFSRSADPASDLAAVASGIENYLMTQGDAVYEEWTYRFRYVTDLVTEVPLLEHTGTIQTDYYIIDSRQRLRDAGSYANYNGSFVPDLQMVRFAAPWYNYERRLADRLAAEEEDEDVLVVPWVTESYAQTDEGRLAIELPDAAEMAKYDRMQIVMKETCAPDARFPVHQGVCPAWDVGHKITMCSDFDSCTGDEHNQLFRNVTGYHSGGWWFEDVSHGLPFFKQGGTQWLRTGRGDFVGTIEFRFYDDGEVEAAEHVSDAKHLIGMGVAQWDQAHNDQFLNYEFTPPPGTVKVMLDARVQGGGNNAPSGCAEFCSHSHRANINGTQFEHTFEMENNSVACAERSGEGVTAGQFGTWFFDRGSWCPGGPVERWQEDITEAVNLEGSNSIVWTGHFQGNEWPPGGGSTATVWLVFYGADGEAITTEVEPEPCPNPPQVTIRDFSKTHPDFEPMVTAWNALEDGDPVKEAARGSLTGVVAPSLVDVGGGVWKPQLAWPENTLPYSTAASFDSWWTDGPDSFTTVPNAGTFYRTRQDTYAFFASSGGKYLERALVDADFGHGDEQLLNQGQPSNSTLTVEIAGDFTYEPGLVLRFANKSDLFVFVDHQLVHESGGMLNKNFGDSRTELSLDGLGLTQGLTYDLHIFAVTARGPWGNPQLWLEHPSCD